MRLGGDAWCGTFFSGDGNVRCEHTTDGVASYFGTIPILGPVRVLAAQLALRSGRIVNHHIHNSNRLNQKPCLQTLQLTRTLTHFVCNSVPWKYQWHRFISQGLHDNVIRWKRFLYYWPFIRAIHCTPYIITHACIHSLKARMNNFIL